jgi:hypothetical protein
MCCRTRFFSKFVMMKVTIKTAGKKGTNAVRKLREQKLRAGLPFMINTKELATNQCYLEYPDGAIRLVTVRHTARDIEVDRELSNYEAIQLRKQFDFALVR